MRKSTLLLLSSLLIWSVQAQIQERPQLSSEHKKLDVWVGEWRYEGSLKDTPLGPGGKFSGSQTARLILDGLFLETKAKDKGVYGGKEITYESVAIQWYDPVTKTYKDHMFDTDGFAGGGVWTVSGNTWTLMGAKTDGKGKTTKHKGTSTFSSDGSTCKATGEISMDGGTTWMPFFELTMNRVKK